MNAAGLTALLFFVIVAGSWATYYLTRWQQGREKTFEEEWQHRHEPSLDRTPAHLFKAEDEVHSRPLLPDDYRDWNMR